MAASYRIILPEQLKLVHIVGRTDYAELERLFITYIRDPEFRPDLRMLVDLREMSDAVTGLWEISKLKQLYKFAYRDTPNAVDVVIVTASATAHRVAQAFALLMRDKKPLNIRLTKDWDQALRWLGLTENSINVPAPGRFSDNVVRLVPSWKEQS